MFAKFVGSLISGIFLGVGPVIAASAFMKETEHWRVEMNPEDDSCLARSAIDASGEIALYYERNDDLLFIIFIAGDESVSRLEIEKFYTKATLKVDNKVFEAFANVTQDYTEQSGDEKNINPPIILIIPLDASSSLDIVRSGREFTGEIDGIALETYSLQGSMKALEYLEECNAQLKGK